MSPPTVAVVKESFTFVSDIFIGYRNAGFVVRGYT